MKGETPSERGKELGKVLRRLYDPCDKHGRDNLIDALTDLRHFADLSGLDFGDCDRQAMNHYREEISAGSIYC